MNSFTCAQRDRIVNSCGPSRTLPLLGRSWDGGFALTPARVAEIILFRAVWLVCGGTWRFTGAASWTDVKVY